MKRICERLSPSWKSLYKEAHSNNAIRTSSLSTIAFTTLWFQHDDMIKSPQSVRAHGLMFINRGSEIQGFATFLNQTWFVSFNHSSKIRKSTRFVIICAQTEERQYWKRIEELTGLKLHLQPAMNLLLPPLAFQCLPLLLPLCYYYVESSEVARSWIWELRIVVMRMVIDVFSLRIASSSVLSSVRDGE